MGVADTASAPDDQSTGLACPGDHLAAPGARGVSGRRDLRKLPKAHLHLHFTGSMRPSTLFELAARHRIRLPLTLRQGAPLRVPADRRGWFRFQRLYDAARACVQDESDLRRIIDEAVSDDAAEGSGRLELQIDPTSYAAHLGGITPVLEIVLDEAHAASRRHHVDVGIIVAASRTRHPLDARALARLAVRHAGDGPGKVIGFGLSNDERSGITSDFAPAFQIARSGGLALMPHGGELCGPSHVKTVVETLLHSAGPSRLGHGVRLAESPRLLDEVVARGIALEVCPSSNVALGVYQEARDVPLHLLLAHGARLALGADDPLLFEDRLVAQYELARDVHLFSDAALADLARDSVRASRAAPVVQRRLLTAIDTWLTTLPEA